MARQFMDSPELQKELAGDEKVLWRGIPEPFPLITEETRKSLKRRWWCCAIAAVIISAGYTAAILATGGMLNVWALSVALLAVAFVAFVPRIDRRNIIKKCRYYISDRRVLLHYGDIEFFSLPREGLRSRIIPAGEGCVHVELGSCVGIRDKKRRVAAFVPRKDDNGNVCGMVLYNVEDGGRLGEILKAE